MWSWEGGKVAAEAVVGETSSVRNLRATRSVPERMPSRLIAVTWHRSLSQ